MSHDTSQPALPAAVPLPGIPRPAVDPASSYATTHTAFLQPSYTQVAPPVLEPSRRRCLGRIFVASSGESIHPHPPLSTPSCSEEFLPSTVKAPWCLLPLPSITLTFEACSPLLSTSSCVLPLPYILPTLTLSLVQCSPSILTSLPLAHFPPPPSTPFPFPSLPWLVCQRQQQHQYCCVEEECLPGACCRAELQRSPHLLHGGQHQRQRGGGECEDSAVGWQRHL